MVNPDGPRKYRSRKFENRIIAFSISHQRESLLAHGLGYDHLRELFIRLARPIVRQSASLAYGGNWRDTQENFTFELLRLISAEQEDNSHHGPDTSLTIGRLYNHSSWPNYLEVTPKVEAQWINSCRVIRVTQQDAGFAVDQVAPDDDYKWRKKTGDARTIFNAAVTLSAMRRLMMDGTTIPIPDTNDEERIPPVDARILLGGGIEHYSGFVPGIFEEALVTFEKHKPIYLLGGFGGAAEILAQAILATGDERPPHLTIDWHLKYNKRLPELLESSQLFRSPAHFRSTEPALNAVFDFVQAARKDLSGTLRTGLNDSDTRELLLTRDIATADRLVRKGLQNKLGLELLPA